MFKNYYEILEILENATKDAIKAAYRQQSKRWHPDRNPDVDTTKMMQDINESYLILSDSIARVKFDAELKYWRANQFHQAESSKTQQDYKYQDAEFNKWVINARFQAIEIVMGIFNEFKAATKRGVKAGAKEAGNHFLAHLLISIIIFILIGLSSSC